MSSVGRRVAVSSLVSLAIATVGLLAFWDKMPGRVPLHYDVFGNPDRWGAKVQLASFVGVMIVLLNAAFSALELLTFRKIMSMTELTLEAISAIGNSFASIKICAAVCAVAYMRFTVYQNTPVATIAALCISIVWMTLAIAVKSTPRNPMLGIRTSSTLNSDSAWMERHHRFSNSLVSFTVCLGVPSTIVGGWIAIGGVFTAFIVAVLWSRRDRGEKLA